MKSIRPILFVFVSGFLVCRVWADLSPEAQTALRRGALAGQQRDFPLALRYFEEARKLAPDAPEIWFNLGLAESKIPGRELRAIAWFGAYLAAHPAALLVRLDAEHEDYRQPCPLHAGYILDLTGFLQSLPANDGERAAIEVVKAAEHHVSAHNTLVEMLGHLPKPDSP